MLHNKKSDKQKKKDDKQKRKRNIKKFFTLVGSIVGIFVIIASAAVYGYVNSESGVAKEQDERENISTDNTQPIEIKQEKKEEDKEGFLQPPRKTNFLVMGLDQEELLSDVVIVGCFDRETKKIDLISIPRDTYVQLSQEDVKTLRDEGRHPPSNGVMKINAVHSYAGKKLGAKYLQQEVEEILGININFYAEVNLEGFRKIVDAIGGVEMEIPEGGFKYYDPTQNLRINVPGGYQLLDGEAAEGVVRFRDTYRRGDLQRIEVQQEFMRNFFKQALNKDTIIGNAPSFFSTIINYVNTNLGITEIPKYIQYVGDLKAENFSICTLPGEAKKIDGVSYYTHYEDETKVLSDNIFYSLEIPVEEPETTDKPFGNFEQIAEIDKKDLKVQILNGGSVEGIASKKRDMLNNDGFNIESVGTYAGIRKNETRIMVKDTRIGELFESYFENNSIIKENALPSGYDAVLIIGLDEQ